ncbi:MAG: UvrD-helicase domain-containing protein [Treponema sp.]|nr:UvrD-helicase domain-containing protein [Treponema sp.]
MNWENFKSMLKKAPDADQEKVIKSLANTIVSAGAGSGKTQTLASRFAYLIVADLTDKSGRPIKNPTVERILTLTFTNKAAAEMYQRIYQTLKLYAKDAPTKEGRDRAQKALDDFSKARIQTLDSYSAGILRQAAALYGIRPDFVSGADGSQTKDLAFDFVLQNRNNEAVQWILDPAKVEECANLFATAVVKNTSLANSANKEKKCRFFEESLEKQKEAIEKKRVAKQNPLAAVEETIDQIEKAFPSEKPKGKNDWFDKIPPIINEWNSERVKKARDYVRNFLPEQGLFADAQKLFDFANSNECLIVLRALEKLNYTNKIADPDINNLIKNILFGDDKKSAGRVNELNGIITFFADIKFLQELHPLLDRFADKANEQRRKTGELTFKDVNELALLAIKEQDALRKQERDSYDFIMIDEFQDNNSANRDLLLAISTDDKGEVMKDRLFFVGDEKQSIYKFRGADVSVFNGLQEYLPDCELLPMRRNYRSASSLLDGFNQIFGGWLPSDTESPSVTDPFARIFEEKPEHAYQAKFDKSARAKFPETKEKDSEGAEPKIQLCLYPANTPDEDKQLKETEAKALYVARKIEELHNDKKIPYRDIALLVKSRTHYAQIARIFSLNKIPFSLDQQGNIFTAATANDFYNALRLCVYPADLNAFLSFLTSPFAGMKLNDAEKILSLYPKKAFDAQINAQEILDEGALKLYQAAENFYKDFSAFALSKPISDSIQRLWQTEGYRFSPDADEGHYDLLFELARSSDADGKDLSWFVDQLAAAKDKSFGDDEAELDIKGTEYPVESSDAVNVMTIHKSKGLEFDWVFVWGLAEQTRGGRTDNSKIFKSDEYGAVVANGKKSQNFFSIAAKAENDSKENAEARRLLYVALTRASQGLFIIGKEAGAKYEPEGNYPALDMIVSYKSGAASPLPFVEAEGGIPQYLRGEERPAQSQEQKSLEQKREDFQSAKTLSVPAAQNFWTSPSALEESSVPKTASQAASLAYPQINSFVNESALQKNEYGTMFHAFMEGWGRDHKNWTKENIGAADFFKAFAPAKKISAQNQEILLDTFFEILKKFLDSKENAALNALQAGRPFLVEHKFKSKIDSYIITGSMDAVFENADGSWTVLDYKTDVKEDPSIYYNQLAAYKKTAADLFTGEDAEKIHCVLFYAETGRFIDISQEAQKALESLDDEKIFNLIEKQEIL